MQANRSRDTTPELAVRRLLHARGLRYRVDYRPVGGVRRRADIVFTRQRVAVFIDGCFWHGCPEHGSRTFKTNADYWVPKIARNMARDLDTATQLKAAGWQVLRFWEHDDPATVADAVEAATRDAAISA
jgi:DNA mismatch endonuclease (patch repair protein)